ncbi:unnamed protein product, partial [Owenia fusiformis]
NFLAQPHYHTNDGDDVESFKMELTSGIASFCIIVTLSITHLEAYKFLQGKIPNGDNVPHPCKSNYIWQGVGHKNANGGGERNAFGLDFNANGKVWTEALCKADSDKDGKTNGEELGDPNCVWMEGQTPAITDTKKLSHPGVCDPWNSPKCQAQNQWEFCDASEFKCPTLDATKDVRNATIRFPPTPVPAAETNYMCLTVPLPEDGDYHMIAMKPIINNTYVMHHMLLYACAEDELPGGENDVRTKFRTPRLCGMSTGCTKLISKWALGYQGECGSDKAAFRIGKNGYKTAVLQMHWNNPELRSDYVDSSGMELYYTPNLRPYDAGYVMTGQRSIVIPPGLPSVRVSGGAASICTKEYMKKPVYVLETLLHMHYLGKAASLEHFRDGKKLNNFGVDEVYDYDSPVTHKFEPPVEFLPGDELFMSCEFDSTSKNTTTRFGDATSDEMCYGFVVYYPEIKNMSDLIQIGNASDCAASLSKTCPDHMGYLFGEGVRNLSNIIVPNCDMEVDGKCTPKCKDVVDEIYRTDGCLSDKYVIDVYKEFLKDNRGMDYVWRGFESCDAERAKDLEKENGVSRPTWTTGQPGAGTDVSVAFTTLIFAALLHTLIC